MKIPDEFNRADSQTVETAFYLVAGKRVPWYRRLYWYIKSIGRK